MNQFAQNMDRFAHYIESLSQRLASTREHIQSAEHISGEAAERTCSELLGELLNELSTSLEKLQESQTEIQRQHEELLQARAEVETERQRYQELFELAPDGYIVTDERGRIWEANQASAKILNSSQHSLVGRTLINYITPEHQPNFHQELSSLEKSDCHHEWIVCLQPHERQAFEAALTVTTVRDREGHLVALRWLLRDITERQQAEQAKLQARLAELTNQELSKEISERRQLEQVLRQQTQALLEANRLKDDFLAIVSHELRSPLNSILGWAQLLRSRRFDEAITARALETIERNARAQKQVIEDLLDVSKIIRGQLKLNICPVNLSAVITAAIENVRSALNAKHLKIAVTFPSNLSLVAGDPDRLQQVIWNLLSNAIKFTPKGGNIDIDLTVTASSVEIQVRDSGQGISPDLLPYIFDHFRQGESAITRHYGGLGLGLAIVRHLVELHGGTVWADSPGLERGATFTIKLPILKAEIKQAPIPPRIIEIETETPFEASPTLRGVSILVVDDDPDVRRLLTFVLEQCGAKVRTAASAYEAIQSIQQVKPDILVSDLSMPGEDGYSLIHAIRALETRQLGLIPAIALTAYTREEDRRDTLLAGFQMHLSKPVEPNQLVQAIARLVEQSEPSLIHRYENQSAE